MLKRYHTYNLTIYNSRVIFQPYRHLNRAFVFEYIFCISFINWSVVRCKEVGVADVKYILIADKKLYPVWLNRNVCQ
jgi:hypothetical protein